MAATARGAATRHPDMNPLSNRPTLNPIIPKEPMPRSTEARNTSGHRDEGDKERLPLKDAIDLLLSPGLDDPLDPLLKLVGEGMAVSRSYLFQLRNGGTVMDNTHEWCAPGVEPQKERLQSVPAESVPWWMDQLHSGRGVVISEIDDLPPEAAEEREILEAQGIQAVLVLPLRWSNGDLSGFMGFDEVKGPRVWTDRERDSLKMICEITVRDLERRKLTRTLQRTRDRLVRTERIARVGGWEFDPANGETWWSDQAFKILGVPLDRRPVTLFQFFQRVHPDDRERARHTTLQILENGEPFHYATRLLPTDGQIRHLEVQGHLDETPEGRRRVVGTVQDITERRRLQDQLSQTHRLEALGQLTAGVAHDFGNLLSVILGATELLLDEAEVDDWCHSDLVQIHRAAERGASLTGKLLSFSRWETDRLGRVELNRLVGGMHRVLRGLLPASIDLQLDLEDEVGEVEVDGGRLEELVVNLALNAREAMAEGDDGTLHIATTAEHVDVPRLLGARQTLTSGDYYVIRVEDDGTGMTPEVQERVFETFFTTRSPDGGRGLGLSQALATVQEVGGGIQVESLPGAGSVFQVFLPAADRAHHDDEGAGPESS